MRKYSMLAAAAPLMLLAACGDREDDTATTEDATATEAVDTAATTAAGDETPGPATRLADAGDYSGTYSYAADDGTRRDVTFNASDRTYSYTAPDGTKKTGTYTIDDDGYRFYVRDFYGRPAYFAFRDGAVYELPNNVSLTGDLVVTGNRYARADSEVFSREPEPGSPVVPEDLGQ